MGKGRTWMAETKLQEIILNTYISKERACKALGITQPTLRRLFLTEGDYTYTQLRQISNDSGIPLIYLIKSIKRCLINPIKK